MGRSNDVLAPSPPSLWALVVLSDPVFSVPWDFDLSRFKFRPHPQHRLPFLLILFNTTIIIFSYLSDTPSSQFCIKCLTYRKFLTSNCIWYPLLQSRHYWINNSIPPSHLRALINMAAVNRKTDVKQKEADVNQKLQLYGIYSGMTSSFKVEISMVMANLLPLIAFANGKVPSVSFLKWLSCNAYHQVVHMSLFRTNKSMSPSTLP